jgi:tRNA (guanine37-N1)-methyltransferase
MQVDVFTLFPEMFDNVMASSMMYKAQDIGALTFRVHDIRDWAANKHRKVDDTPYGGGGGMILQVQPVVAAVEHVLGDAINQTRVLLMTPQGRRFSHGLAVELAAEERLAIICAHYEGPDERIRQTVVTDEISIGDYVLTGGELAAMVVIDATTRFLPGVLGADGAAHRDSHADGLLEGPHYTRPRVFRGLVVPEVLQQGNHAKIANWRREQAIRRTWENRPDLLRQAALTEDEKYLLARLANERSSGKSE